MSQAGYTSDLRAIFRGYWSGVFNQDQFNDLMFNSIDRWLTRAWQAGAKAAGIMPDEITIDEQLKLAAIVFREYSFVPKLSQFIQANNKANGGLLGTVFARVPIWAMRYKDVYNTALASAKSDPKLEWTLGKTEKHCGSCSKLHGKVKRASWWAEHVMPQSPPNPNLECQGWHCDCSLNPTDKPMSRGRMPNLP